MGVGHACRELKSFVHTVGLLFLHAHCIVFGLWVFLSICLVHSDFSDDLITQLLEDGVEKELDILTRFFGLLSNLLSDLHASVFLSLGEVVDVLVFGLLAGVHELVVGHRQHQRSVLEQVLSEVWLQHEKVLFKLINSSNLVVLLDLFLPHAHKFPAFELLEEAEVFDVIVRVTFNEPLSK